MADPKVVKEWLKKADEDMNFSSSIIDESTFYAQICFHFHQAAEKYLNPPRGKPRGMCCL